MVNELIVQKREILGKKVDSLREKGLVPAELYGRGFKNIHLAVPVKDFLKVFERSGESSIVKLKVMGEGSEKELNVLIHDVSRDSLTDKILHVDFYQVRMDEKIKTSVPLKFIGEPPAVKEKDGVLIKAMQEIEVEALPGNLPPNIEVDLSELADIGQSIYVKELKTDKGVKILVEPETVIATVTEKAKEEEVKPAVSVEEVKVEGEEKREDKKKEEEQKQRSE